MYLVNYVTSALFFYLNCSIDQAMPTVIKLYLYCIKDILNPPEHKKYKW